MLIILVIWWWYTSSVVWCTLQKFLTIQCVGHLLYFSSEADSWPSFETDIVRSPNCEVRNYQWCGIGCHFPSPSPHWWADHHINSVAKDREVTEGRPPLHRQGGPATNHSWSDCEEGFWDRGWDWSKERPFKWQITGNCVHQKTAVCIHCNLDIHIIICTHN